MSGSGSAALERAGPDDVEALVALGAAQTRPLTRDEVLREQSAGRLWVLRGPGGLVGWSSARVVADELLIEDLGVAAASRRRGWGRRLLGLLLALGRQRGAATAWLEVRRGNAAARELYRSAGFEEVGVRRDYYEAPREDAVLMRRPLTPETDS